MGGGEVGTDRVHMGRCLEDLSVCLVSSLCLGDLSCSVLGIYSPAPQDTWAGLLCHHWFNCG